MNSEPSADPRPSPHLTVGMEFGLMARPIRAQLRAQKLHLRSGMAREIQQCEKDNHALSRLAIRRIITGRQRDAGRRKLLFKILKCCFISPERMPHA